MQLRAVSGDPTHSTRREWKGLACYHVYPDKCPLSPGIHCHATTLSIHFALHLHSFGGCVTATYCERGLDSFGWGLTPSFSLRLPLFSEVGSDRTSCHKTCIQEVAWLGLDKLCPFHCLIPTSLTDISLHMSSNITAPAFTPKTPASISLGCFLD